MNPEAKEFDFEDAARACINSRRLPLDSPRRMAEVRRMGPEAQLDSFIAKFGKQNQKLIRELRRAIRRRLPQANELVYDNYNFLVIAYCPSQRTQDSFFSLGADAHGVNLFFGYNGSRLPDPRGLLQGSGKLNRFIRLESAKHLAQPEVQQLVSTAIALSKVPLAADSKGQLIIRAISPKQRPRNLDAAPRVRAPARAAPAAKRR